MRPLITEICLKLKVQITFIYTSIEMFTDQRFLLKWNYYNKINFNVKIILCIIALHTAHWYHITVHSKHASVPIKYTPYVTYGTHLHYMYNIIKHFCGSGIHESVYNVVKGSSIKCLDYPSGTIPHSLTSLYEYSHFSLIRTSIIQFYSVIRTEINAKWEQMSKFLNKLIQ